VNGRSVAVFDERGRGVVLAKVDELREKLGGAMDQKLRWFPENWLEVKLPEFRKEVQKFVTNCDSDGRVSWISRQEVLGISETIQELFVGAMIFGYGPVGYGPSRISKIIQENFDFQPRLHRQYNAAGISPINSWDSHRHFDRLIFFGPAFASKFAYFAARKSSSSNQIPLIADINTSWAMWSLAGIPRSVERKNSYLEYVKLLHSWSAEEGLHYSVDELERAVFEIGKDIPRTTAQRLRIARPLADPRIRRE